MGENVEKPQLVNFIAKVLEDAGFRVYKNFKTSQQVIDIYAILPTSIGDFGVVCACKNYDKEWEVGIDDLKEMEIIGKQLKASKVAIITSSSFSSQAQRYGEEKKMKLVDRTNLVALAKRYSEKIQNEKEPARLDRKDEAPAPVDERPARIVAEDGEIGVGLKILLRMPQGDHGPDGRHSPGACLRQPLRRRCDRPHCQKTRAPRDL